MKINFAFEISANRKNFYNEILKVLSFNNNIFYSNGSFGDHYFHASLINYGITNDHFNNVCILTPNKYNNFSTI